MGSQAGWPAALAKVISKVMNPFALSVVLLLLVAYAESNNLEALLKWVVLILLFLVVLPLAYVYVRPAVRKSGIKRMEDPVTFFRQHRREIFVVGIISAVPCILLLIFLKAPSLLLAALVALLTTSLGVALVNRYFRASYHLATITNLIIVVTFIWGQTFLPVLVVVPLVGWARYSLKQHSPTQLAAGFGLSAIIAPAILYAFRLVGNVV